MIQATLACGDCIAACDCDVIVLNRCNLRNLRINLERGNGVECHSTRAKDLRRRPCLAPFQGGDFCQAAFVPLGAAELRR